LGLFAAVALVITAAGIAGMVAWSVSRRFREIGIRMALGARRLDVLGLVVRQGLWMVALGLAVGLGGAFLFTRLLADLLFEVSPLDPVTLITVAVLLLGVGLLACLSPAQRAVRVDPNVAVRAE
jgi:ABC-type antimicrobial peptide transport system permease subunit